MLAEAGAEVLLTDRAWERTAADISDTVRTLLVEPGSGDGDGEAPRSRRTWRSPPTTPCI
ncbi:hypothetical protein SVIO_012540 [Streptomyces violaceusniger]|uniref:Uncharacterized protein n=1 Tax=Streptomyces violaceusniger TaxID=68280 RepID=A0A4D4KMY1_STRVO|nr:hypothetical protein SVIO_012540 [Streptomyces violaceusniger]